MAATARKKTRVERGPNTSLAALGEVRAAIPILVLRMILLAWVVAAIMFGMAQLVGWNTSCAEFPHCNLIIQEDEIRTYYIDNMMPR